MSWYWRRLLWASQYSAIVITLLPTVTCWLANHCLNEPTWISLNVLLPLTFSELHHGGLVAHQHEGVVLAHPSHGLVQV